MTTQPEALRLADELTASVGTQSTYSAMQQAAAELRRQHDEIESLRQAYNIVTEDCRNLTEKVIPNIRAERDALKTELHIAVGMLSTQPDYSATHPMDVLQIVKDAAIDAARSEK